MSFKIRWDVDKIINELSCCYREAASPYNDGYSGWLCKKDLLQVKYQLDDMIDRLPNFSHLEEEFHEEMAKQKTWKTLNDKM